MNFLSNIIRHNIRGLPSPLPGSKTPGPGGLETGFQDHASETAAKAPAFRNTKTGEKIYPGSKPLKAAARRKDTLPIPAEPKPSMGSPTRLEMDTLGKAHPNKKERPGPHQPPSEAAGKQTKSLISKPTETGSKPAAEEKKKGSGKKGATAVNPPQPLKGKAKPKEALLETSPGGGKDLGMPESRFTPKKPSSTLKAQGGKKHSAAKPFQTASPANPETPGETATGQANDYGPAPNPFRPDLELENLSLPLGEGVKATPKPEILEPLPPMATPVPDPQGVVASGVQRPEKQTKPPAAMKNQAEKPTVIIERIDIHVSDDQTRQAAPRENPLAIPLDAYYLRSL